MTLKTSFIKTGILRFQLKRFWWVSAFYTLLLFFVSPFRILCRDKESLLERAERFPDTISSLLLNDGGMFVLLVAAAVLLALCMVRYLQNVRSATLLHALPVTRTELYVTSLLSGFILMAIPILVNALILMGMNLWGDYAKILPLPIIADWVGGQLLSGAAILSFSFFVGILTGSSIAQLVFIFVFCFLPVGLTALCSYLLDGWLFGYTSNGADEVLEFLLQITPIYYPQFVNSEPIWWIPVLAGIYILLFLGLGLWLYHKRDAERAGDVTAFDFMRPLFLYGVSICTMLVGSAFVRSVGSLDGAPHVLLALFFALLGYAVAKALLLKSLRIWRYYKGFVVLGVILLLAYSAIDFNLFGYGTHVPETANIQKVYAGYFYTYNWEKEWESNGSHAVRLTDAESIQAVQKLHETAIAGGNITRKEALKQGKVQVYYGYQTTGGECINRVYYVEPEALYDLFSTKAAKDNMYPNIRLHPENIKYLEWTNKDNKQIYGAEKEELLACIRNDLEVLRFEEISAHDYRLREAAGYVTVTEDKIVETEVRPEERNYSLVVCVDRGEGDHQIWFGFNQNFTQTIQWLQAHGYIE
ncbi:MAG: ABC transporter permease [Ruminococcaceae bacterium]|nr:ABC transporter permease [Oscillospiraceae bacterium]